MTKSGKSFRSSRQGFNSHISFPITLFYRYRSLRLFYCTKLDENKNEKEESAIY